MIIKPAPPYYNIDASVKSIVSDAIYDGYLDEAGALNGRFGLVDFCDVDTGTGGDGLFYWGKRDVTLAVSAGRCFSINPAGVITELTGGDFTSGNKVVFADGQKIDGTAFLYACDGGKLNYSTGGNFTQAASPAPQTSSFVAYNGLRFVANEDGTPRVYFTDVNPTTAEFDPAYWDATENPLTADSRGDNVTGIYQAWDDIAVWGTLGREIWQTTGGSPPIAPRLGALLEAGLIAPYSVKKADNTFFALCDVDGKRAVIRIQDNNPVIISLEIEKILDALTTVSDAVGDIVSVGGQSFYILTFPTEDQTWVYNIKKKEWYQWSYWNVGLATRQAFLGRHFVYATAWGKHLCQSRLTGAIYECDPDEKDDDGVLIRTEWQTGWIDNDTTEYKTLDAMRLHLKRGQTGLGETSSVVTMKYRDNGSLVWKTERQLSLFGLTGEYDFYRRVNDLGHFRSRQFSFVLSDAAKLILVKADLELSKTGT
jgi:hypothetical protein